MKRILIGTGAAVLALVLVVGTVILGAGQQSSNVACGGTGADVASAGQHGAIDGYSGDQLTNAAAIMNAAAVLGLPAQAEVIGVMTAMGESGLRNIDYGDKAGPDSRGLFQQRDSWGTLAQRMNPTTAATLFFQRLAGVANWQTMTPTEAAHTVQVNANPDYYTPYYPKAVDVVQQLSSTDAAACAGGVTDATAQQNAQTIVDASASGAISWLAPSHLPEFQAIAEGKTVPNCGVDPRIVQAIVVAYKTFGRIGISDVNRKCTGEHPAGSFAGDPHDQPTARAVDFYSLGGTATNGADANAIKLLRTLDQVLPAGSGAGQEQARQAAGDSLTLQHITVQFPDSPNHLHIQVPPSNGDDTTGE